MALALALADDPRVPDRNPDTGIVPRRPGPSTPLQYFPPPVDPAQVPAPAPAAPRELLPVEDRWRIMRALGARWPWYDPYNPNVLKGDFSIAGEGWRVTSSAIASPSPNPLSSRERGRFVNHPRQGIREKIG